jgi:predicted RNA-binding Zn ribbon-like protein
MANQLARGKCRKSMAEHKAVIALLEEIASEERVSAMSLMRQAIRRLVRERIAESARPEDFKSAAMEFCPTVPAKVRTARDLSRFKKEQREFDQVLLELHLSGPEAIEERNSVVAPNCKIEVLSRLSLNGLSMFSEIKAEPSTRLHPFLTKRIPRIFPDSC